ncbi:hypothetical protein STVA_41900 [Allostella vacuolata]|nr:hypothetical protein STVA_41900 [Stella vacuolata]
MALVLLSGTLGFGAGMIIVVGVVAVVVGGDPAQVSPSLGLLAGGNGIVICGIAGAGIAILQMARPTDAPAAPRILVETRPGAAQMAPLPIRRHSIRYEAAQDLSRAA